ADVALKAEMRWIRVAQLFADQPDCLLDVAQVRVALFDVTLRDAVRAEEQMNMLRIRVGELLRLFGNLRGERVHVSFVVIPACDVTPPDVPQPPAPVQQRDKILLTRSGRRN